MSDNSIRVARCRRTLKLKAVLYLGGSCYKCGYSKCMAAMDFHHRDPTQKDFAIGSRGLYRSFSKVQTELDKCDLLCANCHRELHDDLYLESASRRGAPNVPWPSGDELGVWVQDSSLTDIAAMRGVSRKTVRHWCKTLGVQLPKHGNRERPVISHRNPVLWPSTESLNIMVWDRPVNQLARELGVSGVAVKKRCKKLGIPTPARGYWASLRASG